MNNFNPVYQLQLKIKFIETISVIITADYKLKIKIYLTVLYSFEPCIITLTSEMPEFIF